MADNPIDLNKIFNFSDTTPLDQVIVKVGQLNSVLDTMLQTAMKSATGMTQSMTAIQKSVESLEAEMQQADVTTKKGQETILKGADATGKAVAQNEEYKKSLTDLNTTIKTLQDQIDKLSESNKKVQTDNDKQSGSLADLKAKLKDATDAYWKLGSATDSSIKADALKRVTDLNKSVQDGTKIINDAKKAVDVAAGSYNELVIKVANATKELKAMEGGVGSNSEKFKTLQKSIADGNEKLKLFDREIGNHQRDVGNYEKATEGLKNQFEGLTGKLGSSGEKLEMISGKALKFWDYVKGLTTGIGGLTAAAGALIAASLEQYFTRTSQGALELFQITTRLEYEWIKTKDALASFGGFLANVVKNTDAVKIATLTLNAIQGSASKEFEQNELRGRKLIKERIQLEEQDSHETLERNKLIFESRDKLHKTAEQRLEDAEKALELTKEISDAQTKLAEKEAQQQIRSIIVKSGRNGIADLNAEDSEKVLALLKKVDEAKSTQFTSTRRLQAEIIQIYEELYKREVELSKENLEAQRGIDNALLQSNIEKNNAILNNTRSTEDQRKQAIMKNAIDEIKIEKNNTQLLIAEITQRAKDRIRLQMGQANFDAQSPEAQQKLIQSDATLQKEIIRIQQDAANKILQINLNKEKALLDTTNIFTQRRIDNALNLFIHEKDAANATAQAQIEANNRVLKNEDSTYDERLHSIQDITIKQLQIAENNRDKEIKAKQAETQKKILIDGDYLTHYIDMYAQIDKIDEDYKNNVSKINADLKIATRENIFTVLSRDLKVLDDRLTSLTDEQLIRLNNEFKKSGLSIAEYERQKNKLIRTSNIDRWTEELNLLEQERQKLILTHTDTEANITENLRKQAELRKNISESETKFREGKLKDIHELEKQLANKTLDAIVSFLKNESDAKIQSLDEQMAAIEESANKQLELAGNNQAAKDAINKRAKEQEAKIQKEEKKIKHDEAVFEKRLSEAKIILNTLVAASEAGWITPAAILIEAIGAVELAVAESTPIPAYFTGTKFSKEGPAWVAEKGPELAIAPSGKVNLYDTPQIANLELGTKILNNQETEPILKKMDTKHMDLVSQQLVDIGIRDIQIREGVNNEIIHKLDEVKEVTKKNKPVQLNYAKVGAMVYEFKKEEDSYVKRTKALSMGSF
jgi:hypothetical protein